MARFLAGAAACFLLITGAFLLWQGEAQAPLLPEAPPAPAGAPSVAVAAAVPQAPEATPKSREQKRFSRADKDKNGMIAKEELSPRAARPMPSSTPTATVRCRSTNGRSKR